MSSHDESILGELTRLIPGYGAYRDQESRRKDDRLTREFLVKRLADGKSSLDELGRRAAETGNLDTPMNTEKVRDQIDLAQSRLSAAVEGYAGWFSDRTVDSQLLGKIAEMDANLVSLADQIDALGKELVTADQPDMKQIKETVDLLLARIDRRSEVLKSGS